ncbi:hypothetical protein [Parabacteroides johnsonii]|uniref:O-antigen polymerase n=1 Tax=Parabacteroides johnsonii CL02T12C29 TaxID=999419 RepID=K5ZQV2_9BACT|nr:hypothetical protein [Parabacteroides johnsonii]EKN05753.1 hypothetical protein HMPREF1077_03734 [Parabacteroides johnsonii CL02T12C29]
MIQEFIDKNFFRLFVFTLIFGVVFYDTIGFDYTDELCSLFVFLLFAKYVFSTPKWEINRLFLIVTAVFLLYLCYSFYIGSNVKKGIIVDFVVQYKPYLAFFCVYAMKPVIKPVYRKLICEICIVIGIYSAVVGVTYLIFPDIMGYTFKHPSRLATAAVVIGFSYLYCCDYSQKDKIIFILLMAVAICSGRSKAYGFFIICATMVWFMKPTFKWKLNLKNILAFLALTVVVLIFTYKKIDAYFIGGGGYVADNEEVKETIARAAFYVNSIDILKDYFPFGSGYASYGTFASGNYYSDIYVQYGMDGIYGLVKNDCPFVADTYYPALAQFGVVGVFLFFLFWGYLGVKSLKYYRVAHKEALMVMMIVIFFVIESIADATITSNRGVFVMMLLGLLFSDFRKTEVKQLS